MEIYTLTLIISIVFGKFMYHWKQAKKQNQ